MLTSWRVEIVEIIGSFPLLQAVAKVTGYRIREAPRDPRCAWIIHHAKFDDFKHAAPIRADALALRDLLREFGALHGVVLDFELGAVQHVGAHGEVTRFIAPSSAPAPYEPVATAALLELKQSGQEMTQALAAAQTQIEERRILRLRKAAAAYRDERARQVIELLDSDAPTLTQLAQLVDLVQDACAGDLTGFAADTDLERLLHSINPIRPLPMSCMAVSPQSSPSPPLTFAEMMGLAHRIGRTWLATRNAS